MRFQQRDAAILEAIYQNEGVLAKRHIKSLFWSNGKERTMQIRLAKLRNANYIDWPTVEQRRNYPLPEPVCWLDMKGAIYIASTRGADIQEPSVSNENQCRSLQKNLRKEGIRWVRQPRWSLLRHDIATMGVKLAVMKSAMASARFTFNRWIPESEFRGKLDKVKVPVFGRDGKRSLVDKGVCPDGYFEVMDEARQSLGKPGRGRFLLEIDMSTHDPNRFGRNKILPGVAYILSDAYHARFGVNSGRWLVITSGGETRLKNLVQQAQENARSKSSWFYFTRIDQIQSANLFTDPIWWQANIDYPVQLFTNSP